MLRRSLFPVGTMRSLWTYDNNNNDHNDDRPDNNDNDNDDPRTDDNDDDNDFHDFHDNDFHKYKFNDHNDRPELARMRRDGAGNSRLDDHFPTFRDPGNRNIYEKCGLLPIRQLEPRGNGSTYNLVEYFEQVASP